LKCYCLCVVLVGQLELGLITYSKSMASQIQTGAASSVLRRKAKIYGDYKYFLSVVSFPFVDTENTQADKYSNCCFRRISLECCRLCASLFFKLSFRILTWILALLLRVCSAFCLDPAGSCWYQTCFALICHGCSLSSGINFIITASCHSCNLY